MNIPVLLAFMVFFGVFAGNYFLNFDFEKGKAKEGAFTFTPLFQRVASKDCARAL